MPELTPLDDNRQEHFLNGEDLEPITRREHFYAGRESELPEGHQEPETREEWFIQKYRGGGGDVTVVPLSVTENGTYSEEGKAYSPVSVDVPLPQNAYLLKSVNTPTPIASFSDGEEMVMPSLKVAIEPQQDLHGYDSPWVGGAGKNKYSGGNVTVNNTLFADISVSPIPAGTYTISVNLSNETTDDVRVAFRKADGTAINATGITYNASGRSVGVITTTETAERIYFYYGSSTSGTGTRTYTDIQIEEGTIATTFASYSNICPISGWDEADVSVSGVNVWDEEWEVGDIDAQGNPTSSTTLIRAKNFNPCKPNTTYKVAIPSGSSMYMKYYDNNKNFISPTVSAGSTITTPSNCYYFKFVMGSAYGTTYNNDISINYPSTDTSYHAYNGQTYTIDLDGTRYGGTLDVVNGIVTPAPYYASYNGETLTGEWISDRDKYEVGATPTIGAQVVNIGASGTPVSILPTAVKSLRGVNNVYANTGDIKDAEYFSKEV